MISIEAIKSLEEALTEERRRADILRYKIDQIRADFEDMQDRIDSALYYLEEDCGDVRMAIKVLRGDV